MNLPNEGQFIVLKHSEMGDILAGIFKAGFFEVNGCVLAPIQVESWVDASEAFEAALRNAKDQALKAADELLLAMHTIHNEGLK